LRERRRGHDQAEETAEPQTVHHRPKLAYEPVLSKNNPMSEGSNNLVLEPLRHIRSAVDQMRLDVREVKTRVGLLEQQYATISNRVDRIEDRLERIERRIGLIEA